MWSRKKVNDFDLIMDREEAKEMVKKQGWSGFFEQISSEYEDYNFFSCSEAWYECENEPYICKFKGDNGDIIIGWKGVHDK